MKRPLQSQALLTALLGFVVLLSFVSASQKAILKGGSHENIPLKKGEAPLEAIKNYKKTIGLTDYLNYDVIHIQGDDDYELRWDDGGSFDNFCFETGDSLAQWFRPLAGGVVKKIILYNIDFEGSIDYLRLQTTDYSGEVSSKECSDSNGWVGIFVNENGDPCDGYDEECTWVSGDNECYYNPMLEDNIWPGFDTGGFTLPITSEEANSWIEVDMGQIGYADIGSNPFMFSGKIHKQNGCGFGAWSDPKTPYHSFKYYAQNGPSGNPGWHILSIGLEIYVIVEYYEDIPPFISDAEFSYPEVCATIIDENPEGDSSGVSESWLFWQVADIVDSTQMSTEQDDLYCDTIHEIDQGDEMVWWIGAVDVNGNWAYSDEYSYALPVSVIGDSMENVPKSFFISQPSPNPFNPTTSIEFSMPHSGQITLTVYDILGREIDTILNQQMNAGHHRVQWNASNVPTGIYFIRMVSGDFSQTLKVMVLK